MAGNETVAQIRNAAGRMDQKRVILLVDRAALTIRMSGSNADTPIDRFHLMHVDGEAAANLISEADAYVDIAERAVTFDEAMLFVFEGYLSYNANYLRFSGEGSSSGALCSLQAGSRRREHQQL